MELTNLPNSLAQSWTTSFTQWLNEQEWFQPLKAKWEELDPQSRIYLQLSMIAVGALFFAYLTLSSILSVRTLRREVADKSAMLAQIQSANDEIKRLKSVNSSLSSAVEAASGEASGPWAPYLEGLATQIGIGHDSFVVGDGKPGATSDLSKEMLYDLSVKKVNVHQLVRLAYAIESGGRPVKLRDLTITTAPDLSGYLDAVLSVSAFSMVKSDSGK